MSEVRKNLIDDHENKAQDEEEVVPTTAEDESASDDEPVDPTNTWLGIQIKQPFGFSQWLALPVLAMGTMVVGVYMNT